MNSKVTGLEKKKPQFPEVQGSKISLKIKTSLSARKTKNDSKLV